MKEPPPDSGEGFDRELGETEPTVRDENSAVGRVAFWAGVAISIATVYFNTLGTLSEFWTSAIHFGAFGFLCALIFPIARSHGPRIRKSLLAVDVVIGILAPACVAYLITNEQALFDRGVHFVPTDWVVSIVGILLAIEFTRRTTGWIIPILIVISLTYVAWWGR
jgi:TRAP-type uncharacterized transport system fused permease subunit